MPRPYQEVVRDWHSGQISESDFAEQLFAPGRLANDAAMIKMAKNEMLVLGMAWSEVLDMTERLKGYSKQIASGVTKP